jgi:hypothetical protein
MRTPAAERQWRFRRRKLAMLRAHKAAVGCRDCGERDPIVLDLHHRDPDEKSPRLRYRGRSHSTGLIDMSLAALMEELAKCDVLCANCHRRETHRRVVANGLASEDGSTQMTLAAAP